MHSSEDDEENEEIMRANANIMRNSNRHGNTSGAAGAGAGAASSKQQQQIYPTKSIAAGQSMDTSKSAADNWKGIGNRHMASQEYEEAYKAYSTALSISPLGPSSHIYLSNRAASLLSLKRYSAASVDARRAITLAPTFGKAHARLGQSLYFLKDYAGAVAAYENAFQFEPDNQVTWTYLNKARRKFEKESERKRRREEERIDEMVNADAGANLGTGSKARGVGEGRNSYSGGQEQQYQQKQNRRQKQEENNGGEYYEKGQRQQQQQRHGIKNKEEYTENDYDDDAEDATTVDGSVKFSVIGESTAVKDRAVAVLSSDLHGQGRGHGNTHSEGDDIDELVAAVDRGETSIVRGKLQAALDSSDAVREQGSGHGHGHANHNTHDSLDIEDVNETGEYIDDPDFDEALRLQEVAAIKLVNKEYRGAVEEFSAALFLVPDDTNLTPQLYVGRAHALNGLQRHEGALNDSMMALGRNPELPEAHVVLARTYFYVKNFSGAVASFEDAKEILKERGLGHQLSPLDELYYEKAVENSKTLGDAEFDEERSYRSLAMHSDKPIPKLKPPRFVSRQELLNTTTNVPPMPKSFSKQIPSLPATLRVGIERKVLFVTEAMGIKLNRGQDGVIRVLTVAPETPNSKHTRRGEINPGDIIREAAGVDLRRPLTNIMWSDTVALMKISPRPLEIIVARELSERPPGVEEEFEKNGIKSPRRRRRPDPPRGYDPPSRASGTEPVAKALSEVNDMQEEVMNLDEESIDEEDLLVPFPTKSPREHDESIKNSSRNLLDQEDEDNDDNEDSIKNSGEGQGQDEVISDDDVDKSTESQQIPVIEGEKPGKTKERTLSDELDMMDINESKTSKEEVVPNIIEAEKIKTEEESCTTDQNHDSNKEVESHGKVDSERSIGLERHESERLEVLKTFLDKDFIFPKVDESDPLYKQTKGFTNTKWLAESGSRNFIACGDVYVFEKSNSFWKSSQFVLRTLALYSDLLVVGRAPNNANEIRSSFSDPTQSDIFAGMEDIDLMESFLIAEFVIDLNTCKLRRSTLTTPSSVVDETNEDEHPIKNKEISELCFEVLTPTQKLIISAQNPNEAVVSNNSNRHLGDNKILFLTTQWEESIKDALCVLHQNLLPSDNDDKSWVHQCILGTLHSYVISGNCSLLEKALLDKGDQKSPYPGIDDVDEDGLTALHHACFCRSHMAVTVLLNAGASCSKPTLKGRETPCHISAQQLDAKSLSMILSQSQPTRPDPNALNANGHTPMTVAFIKGRAPGGSRHPSSLNMCVASLQAWGGSLHVSYSPHPIFTLSSAWCYDELDIVFPLSDCKFPVIGNGIEGYSKSLAALYDYPLHTCLVTLRQKIAKISGTSRIFPPQSAPNQYAVVRTLEASLNYGFEPNERIEIVNEGTNPLNEMIGYTPLQILAAAALDLLHKVQVTKCNEDHPDIKAATSIIASSAEMLVTKGGRLSIDQPCKERFSEDKKLPIKSPMKSPAKQKSKKVKSQDDLILRYIKPSEVNIEKNKEIMKILDANESLAKCEAKWQEKRVVKGTGQSDFLQGKGLSIKIENCKLAGGSDDKNCAICWKKFGSLMNRKHICRASRRYVCESCSSKSVLLDVDGRRVTDGQFNLAKCHADRKEEQDRLNYEIKKKERKSRIQAAWTKSHRRKNPLQETQKDESSAKDELFGNVGRAMKNFFMEEVDVEDPQDANVNDRVSGVMSSLNQTGEAFRERGEKLNSLAEKTDKLKNASEDFAKMARELKESQQKGFFW